MIVTCMNDLKPLSHVCIKIDYRIVGIFRGGKYLFFGNKSFLFSFLLHQRHFIIQAATPIL